MYAPYRDVTEFSDVHTFKKQLLQETEKGAQSKSNRSPFSIRNLLIIN